jgi:hypothetical protein
MSNKDFDRLSDIDKRIRRMFPNQMWDNDEVICTIQLFGGFELFNTRPYHNYESWSSGYRITTSEKFSSIVVESEDLDDAINLLEIKMYAFKNKKESDENRT